MNETRPESWIVLKMTEKDKEPIYKVYATWRGGYLDGDSWKMNSGITKVEEKEDYILFHGASGSVYACAKPCYGTSFFTRGELDHIIKQAKSLLGATIEEMPEDTDWLKLLD